MLDRGVDEAVLFSLRLKHLQISLVALLIVFAAFAGRIPARRRYLVADPPPTYRMLPVPMTPKGRVFAPTLLRLARDLCKPRVRAAPLLDSGVRRKSNTHCFYWSRRADSNR